MSKVTSHQYARGLKALAEWLLEKPEFVAGYSEPHIDLFPGGKKEFLEAVRACGTGKKHNGGADGSIFVFRPDTPEGSRLELNINKNVVCKLVRPAEYECEPLLSQEEEAQVG